MKTNGFMSPDEYRATYGPRRDNVVPMAGLPAPSNVTDGRNFGDEIWALIGGYAVSAATQDQAAKVSAVYFCGSILGEVIGNLPIQIMEGDKPAEGFDLADTLSYAPNPLQTGAEFWPSMVYRAALSGASFAEPVVSQTGEIELWALHPDRQAIEWRERGFTLTYSPARGPQRIFNPSQLFWIAGLSDSRIEPMVPWKMAKGSIDFALALESQGRTFIQNGKKLAGVVETDKALGDEVFLRLQQGMKKWRTGQTPLLEDGLKYKSIASSNEQAQFVELIRQRTLELARYWHIPRSMIGEEGGAAANQENEKQLFASFTVRPWCRRIEQAIWQRLLTPDQRRRYSVKLNMDGFLRGDSATQHKNAVLARTAGTHSINDIRAGWFNLPRIEEPWADDPRTPLNSNRAADTMMGGETSPQDRTGADNG